MSVHIRINSSTPDSSPDHWGPRLSATQPSPTMTPVQQTPRDFLLNSVSEDERGTRSPPLNYNSVNCVCGPDCQSECCRRRLYGRQPLGSEKANEKVLILPKGANENNFSVSSYGSTDSTEPLMRGEIEVWKLSAREQGRNSGTPSCRIASWWYCIAGIALSRLLKRALVFNEIESTHNSTIKVCQSPNGGPSFVVHARRSPLEQSVRCECHVKVVDDTTRKAKIKLVTACLVALFFMIGEVIGGYLAGSLAIMTDAAHMLSDFAGFLISLFAIWVASRSPSKRMSFGWHRAEVVGAVVSVLIIWVLTGVLVYEAILRCIHRQFEVNANIMLITACAGVFVNVLMCAVLHQHSHGHGGGHGHSHGHGGGHGHSHTQGHSHDHAINARMEESASARSKQHKKKKRNSEQNINVRAAFIHVIGDLIQSIGVVIAGYIIWFKPEWKIADPICTFLFSILVLFSTLNVMRDALRVLMEGTPKHINYEAVKVELEKVRGVKQAHSLHIWSLTLNKIALAAHLVLEPGANNQQVLTQASQMLKGQYNIHQTTLQVEDFHPTMDECGTCQPPATSKSKLLSCWP